jgi:signal peptide peptidase SppA
MWTDRLAAMMPPALRASNVVVPVVRINGAIGMPAAFRRGVSMESLAGPLERAFGIRAAPAVALVINSPGGTPVQAHLIYKRIRALAVEKQKTVLAFVEDVAASGGYMIALAADEIIVDPSSIVGSIGVVSAGFGFQELIAKVGVERRVHTAGQKKVMLDPFAPERPEDVAHLENLQREIHALFIAMVKERRGARLKEDPDMFSGAFWSGTRGVELGLADRLGDARSVLRALYGDKVATPIIGARRSFWQRRLGIPSALAGESAGAIMSAVEERAIWSRFGL